MASQSQETFQEENWLEFQLSRGESEKKSKTWVEVFTIKTVPYQTTCNSSTRTLRPPRGRHRSPAQWNSLGMLMSSPTA